LKTKLLRTDNAQLLAIAAQYGTPTYVYDTAIIQKRFQQFSDAFVSVPHKVRFAIKALTNPNILRFLKQMGCEVDCVSIEEVYISLQIGYKPEQISYTPSGVDFEELYAVAKLGVNIHLDNIPQMEQLGDAIPGINIFIRIRPDIMAGGNEKISVGHERSKFGLPFSKIPQVIALEAAKKIRVHGLHVHTGSDIKDAKVFIEVAKMLFDHLHYFPNVAYLDFGGGYKVPYTDGEATTDLEDIASVLQNLNTQFRTVTKRQLTYIFEPGKFLVAECGTLLVKTTLIKEDEVSFAHINTGLNHLIRPMFYDAHHDIENLSNPNGDKKTYDIVGYICETDTFATDRTVNAIRVGDILKISNAGAYGFTMASNYNSRVLPSEVMIYKNEAILIRSAQFLDDILKNVISYDFKK
jgi:diaminopimelate decarboxylase